MLTFILLLLPLGKVFHWFLETALPVSKRKPWSLLAAAVCLSALRKWLNKFVWKDLLNNNSFCLCSAFWKKDVVWFHPFNDRDAMEVTFRNEKLTLCIWAVKYCIICCDHGLGVRAQIGFIHWFLSSPCTGEFLAICWDPNPDSQSTSSCPHFALWYLFGRWLMCYPKRLNSCEIAEERASWEGSNWLLRELASSWVVPIILEHSSSLLPRIKATFFPFAFPKSLGEGSDKLSFEVGILCFFLSVTIIK